MPSKKLTRYLIFFTLLVGIIIFQAFSVSAQTSSTYVPLAPLPYTSPGPIPTSGLLATYIPQVFKFMIVLTVFLSVIYIILGGVQYISTDSFTGKNDGKEKIKDALKGLLLAIVAWLILYTINPTLVVFNFNFDFKQPAISSSNLISGGTATTINTNTTDQQLSQELAQAILQQGGFTFSSTGNCTDPTNSSCTSVAGMHEDTISGLIGLKQACTTCNNLVISGGTEVGHSDGTLSHESGFKADISNTQGDASQFNSFLTQQIQTQTGQTPQTNGFYNISENGTNYVVHPESNHWDIVVVPSGSQTSPTP